MSALNSMIYRLVNIPMNKTNYNKEYNTIMKIAENNGYNKWVVRNMVTKHKTKLHNKQNPISKLTPIKEKNNNIKFATFNYVDNRIHAITKILRKENFKIAYRTNQNLKRKLHNNNNNNIDKMEGNGIYKLTCNDCKKVYIGQTGRKFKQRFKEHVNDFRYNGTRSSYAKHLLSTGHRIDNIDNTLEILHNYKKGNRLNILENFQIYKNKNNILNETTIDHNHLFELATAVT